MASYVIKADGVTRMRNRYWDSATLALDQIDVQRSYPESVITTEFHTPEWEKP